MASYQNYQRYRHQREGAGFRYGKVFLIIIALVLIYLIARAIFGGGAKVDNTNTESNTVGTNAAITNTMVNGNANINAANTNGVTNSATNTSASAAGFSVKDDCASALSRGGTGTKAMSLTFNVGTTKEGEIDKVLSTLSGSGTPAAFFVTGDVASASAELVKKISQAGFPVYNFGNSLVNFTDLPETGVSEQLTKADAAIVAATGKSSKPFFRPPYGSVDADVTAAAQADGFCPVTWTVDALDWSSDSTAASSKERVLSKAANGAIVLMQAANSITAEILPGVITELKAKGYNLVDLPTLFSQ